ncbi:MAG: CPBP family intramembrane metalloprotease [Candidatus Cloacimonetes bacterium]|nr:CPBP family intramembrane metalloprotease [Candidatus Cloacimonadota bacterium]
MFRKPLFWIVFAAAVVVAAVFCLQNFDELMGFINLEITMDRSEALQAARNDGAEWNVGIPKSHQAVIFDEDTFLQYYIELEAGGKEAYNEFLKEGLYQPYQWAVRHFVPGEEKTAYFFYTPDGKFYGFQENVPETEIRNNLSKKEARILAKTAAVKMGIDLENFTPADSTTEEVSSGRIDHTFVYERPQLLEKARYRCRIVVSGDRVSTIVRDMKIPEAFSRRYNEMRSANNIIASVASYGMLFFYGLLGIGLGSFFLLRAHYLLYKRAVFWAFIVSFLGFLADFNMLPLSWMWYDTAVSPQTHIAQTILMSLMGFIQNFILLGISFMAAESLTRKAFPNHLQFWKTLGPQSAPSLRQLGNTMGGYGMVPLNLAFVLGFYLITAQKLGWWNPAGLQVDPNFIAMPMPWLSVLSMALHAGFWEEALFRAVPLAGMVLIGRQLNKEKLFLVIGIIVQMLIFSAGHANYAAQPSYARVVELMIPSLLFAFLYLRFGLYTGIILHFVFDAVLMAMYIWIMKAPGIWFNRIMVLLGIFLPLLVILFYRWKQGKWIEIKETLLNKGWLPQPVKDKAARELEPELKSWNPKTLKYIIILTLAGILSWALFTNFKPDQPKMTLSRKQAINIAQQAFKNVDLKSELNWRIDARISNHINESDKLVWQEGGKALYRQAIGEFVKEPVWEISFRTFEGDVAERAESYTFQINRTRKIVSFDHRLPEDRFLLSIPEKSAYDLALSKIRQIYKINTAELTELTISSEKLPHRTDWNFTWKDTLHYPLETGEYRYAAKICGQQVMRLSRYTYVPEEWSRNERNRLRSRDIFKTFTSIFLILFYLLIGIIGVVSWSGGKFNLKIFYFVMILMVISTFILRLNQWPSATVDFTTSQPWNNQVLQYVLSSLVHILLLSFVFALMAGFLGIRQNTGKANRISLGTIFLAAAGFSGISALAEFINPGHLPWRPDFTNLANYIPLLTTLLESISRWISTSLLFIFLVHWLSKITSNGEKRKLLSFVIFFAFILITNRSSLVYGEFGDFAYLLLSSGLRALVMNFLFRRLLTLDLTILPFFMAIAMMFSNLQLVLAAPYKGAGLSNLLAVILIIVLSLFWVKLQRQKGV